MDIIAQAIGIVAMIFNILSFQQKTDKGGIGLQLGTGFTVGYLVYQIGTLITTGQLGAGFLPGLIAVAVFATILVFLCIRSSKKLKAENELKAKNRETVKSR